MHVAACGDDLVFLDRASDDYAVLPGLADRVVFAPGSRRCDASGDALGALEEAGLAYRVEPTPFGAFLHSPRS